MSTKPDQVQGGMGEVYRATDTNLKRPVAIKVLPASVAGEGTRVSVVAVATRPTFRLVSAEATLPRPLMNAGGDQVRLYDMALDGRQTDGFFTSASASASSEDRFRVVLDWVDELKRPVPVK